MVNFLRKHKLLSPGLVLFPLLLSGSIVQARRNEVLCEIRMSGVTNAEKNAGVWVDGTYFGYLKELKGSKKLMLAPGEHTLTFRQTGYKDLSTRTVLGPGQIAKLYVAMQRDPLAQYPSETAEVKLAVWPKRAAVFVDDNFVGHVSEFDGIGKGLLLSPGKHRFEITLPGWQPFETVATLEPHQRFQLKTVLAPWDIRETAPPVKERPEKSAQLRGGPFNP